MLYPTGGVKIRAQDEESPTADTERKMVLWQTIKTNITILITTKPLIKRNSPLCTTHPSTSPRLAWTPPWAMCRKAGWLVQLLVSFLTCGFGAIAMQIWGIVEGIKLLDGRINTDANGVFLKD